MERQAHCASCHVKAADGRNTLCGFTPEWQLDATVTVRCSGNSSSRLPDHPKPPRTVTVLYDIQITRSRVSGTWKCSQNSFKWFCFFLSVSKNYFQFKYQFHFKFGFMRFFDDFYSILFLFWKDRKKSAEVGRLPALPLFYEPSSVPRINLSGMQQRQA